MLRVTRAVARGNPRCRVLIGLPTYGKGPRSHHAGAENIRTALKGVREGLEDPRTKRSVFAGVAPFADYTTQPEEWEGYRALWGFSTLLASSNVRFACCSTSSQRLICALNCWAPRPTWIWQQSKRSSSSGISSPTVAK